MNTVFSKRLGLSLPVIQAPMAGGGDTPDLVAAVCEAGGLGSVGAAYLGPEQILRAGEEVRRRTKRPFGISLFAPTPEAAPAADAGKMLLRLASYYDELGIPVPALPELVESAGNNFEDQLGAALQTEASVFSFTFGMLPSSAADAIRARGLVLLGTATTVDEAIALEGAGVDAVIVQGSEAGGHRGSFLPDSGEVGAVGTASLVPQAADAVKVPVIASGGIMDGRGIVAALALGASAVQMGTAFLTCNEAGVPEAYKEAILGASEDQTRITRAFSGRSARGIVNRFMVEVGRAESDGGILPFPLQNRLTRPIRAAAAKQGRAEFLSLWAGQGVRLAKRQPAAELMARLACEMNSALAGLNELQAQDTER